MSGMSFERKRNVLKNNLRKNRNGFTLIELLVVIAIIAICLRLDLGFYLLILAYFSKMFSWFLENSVADF